MASLVGGSAASGVHCFPGANLQFVQCLVCVNVGCMRASVPECLFVHIHYVGCINVRVQR